MEVNMNLNNNAFVIAHTSCDNAMPEFLVEEDNNVMKFKSKAWIGWLIFATISWPLLAPRYTHLQSILAIIFS